MILQQPKGKKTKPVRKGGTKVKSNGRYGPTRDVKLEVPFKPTPPQNLPQASSGLWADAPVGPILPSCLSLPPSIRHSVDNQDGDRIPNMSNPEPSLYDLISSKFDDVINSIDEESFSGDRKDLGESMASWPVS